ncbi:MarR family winged helix-turn-helix transcriptional regulator [Phytohabitans kaempferiae]|uniref:MarR family winged helix-turn-helix transcriptional regulator n=1 Tax=Phytohabitans kaempferiae TaxID=1620943 RepID=A0ABV6MGH3_9ACTN
MSTETCGDEELPRTGRRLGLLRVALGQALDAVLAQVGPAHPDLRRAHLLIFRFDGIEGSTTAELAVHAGMTKQSMHELVIHLERHGYVSRGPDPGDTRARLLHLTPSGRALERDVHHAIAAVLESWREQVGAARFDALWVTLQDITGERAPLADLAELRARRRR